MALFKIPQREELNINKIVAKAKEEQERPTIKLKGTSLTDTIATITNRVNTQLGKEKDNYICITSDEEFIEYCRQAVKDGIVAIDTETTGLDTMLVKLVGVCIYSSSQKPAYVPVGHISTITEMPVPNQVSIGVIKEGLELFNTNKTKCIFHHAYYDIVVIYRNTGVMLDIYWDTLVAAFLLNENESHSLKDLYVKYVLDGNAESHYFSDLFEGIPFCYIPYKVGGIYGAKDAKMTYDLYKFQLPYLTPGTEECEECDLSRVAKLYYKEEIPLLEVLIDMKLRGVHVDSNRAKEIKDKYELLYNDCRSEYEKKIQLVQDKIDAYNNAHPLKTLENPPNPSSPEQMKVFFYQILEVPPGIYKKEPMGTGKNVMKAVLNCEELKNTITYETIDILQKLKTYEKLLNSFIYKIPEEADIHGGTVHCNFNSVGVHTGRLSSSNFNLQNIPSKYGDIRNLFTAGEGRCFVGGDFSRQEVAICAVMSNSQGMLQSFIDNKDIYSAVAELAYKTIDKNITYEDCLEHNPDGSVNKEGKQRRSAAKAIVLGILYAKQIPSIAADLNISIEAAQQVYDSIMKAFPDLKEWMDKQIHFAETHGYVEGYFGRRRRLPELLEPDFTFKFKNDVEESTKKYYTSLYKSKLQKAKWRSEKEEIIQEAKCKGLQIEDNRQTKSKTYRQVINSLVQGSSADCTKRAMLLIHNNKRLHELDCKLELTIHDEVQCTVPKENAVEASKIIEQCMKQSAGDIPIELMVDMVISDCWYGEEYKIVEGKLVK